MTRTERLFMKLAKLDAPFGKVEVTPPEDEDGDWYVNLFMVSATAFTLQEALEEALEEAKQHPDRVAPRNRPKKQSKAKAT